MYKAVVILVVTVLLGWLPQAGAKVSINAARVWPAPDYTRLTLESDQAIRHNMFNVYNPERLVIDLEDVELGTALDNLTTLIREDDPYIRSVRVGRFKPGIVRLVLDLKSNVKPQLFELKPIGGYGYRLVLDVYPAEPVDPLMALLEQLQSEAPQAPDADNAADRTSRDRTRLTRGQHDRSSGTATRSGKRATRRRSNGRTTIIAIDAGHGGEDPGAVGKRGTYEKNVTLAIARRLKAIVDRSPDMRAVLIRDGDYFIPLGTRVAKARRINADLFISIHADAFIKPDARGSSVFALSEHGATSAAARWLAKKENKADLIGGVNIAVKDPYLARTLLDLSQTATINDSMKLAKQVLTELSNINDLHRGIVEQAGFAVLKAPDIPSILVETAFISNPVEERHLTDRKYQDKLANAIMNGVAQYFAQNPAMARPKIARND